MSIVRKITSTRTARCCRDLARAMASAAPAREP